MKIKHFNHSLYMADGNALSFGSTTGTKIGTTTGTKLGFWGATAVTRPSGWAGTTGTVSRLQLNTATASTADVAQSLAALINDLTAIGVIGS